MRRTAWVAAGAAVVAALSLAAPAEGAAGSAAPAQVPVHAASTGLSTLASRWAPHVPGAARYDGRIPASVRRAAIQVGVGAVTSMPRTTRATYRLHPRRPRIGASSWISTG